MPRPLFALALLLVYFALTFGVRTWLQLRRTGHTGFHGISGRVFSAAWSGGVLFVAAMLLAFAAPLAEWYGLVAPLLEPCPELAELGEHVVLLGILATVAAQQDMGASWRIGVRSGEQTDLVMTGAFALVRNPIFSAMLLTGLGFVLLLPNPLTLASFATLLLAVELQVRGAEEPHLLRTHGDRYRTYARRVGRFLPGLGRLP